jgi:hypothetical protein
MRGGEQLAGTSLGTFPVTTRMGPYRRFSVSDLCLLSSFLSELSDLDSRRAFSPSGVAILGRFSAAQGRLFTRCESSFDGVALSSLPHGAASGRRGIQEWDGERSAVTGTCPRRGACNVCPRSQYLQPAPSVLTRVLVRAKPKRLPGGLLPCCQALRSSPR